MNGMALHGGLIPYGGTFLIFSDYMRPPIRLAAMMGLRVIYVFTHDSIGLGEDGPTHQPIEQLAALRAIPNLTVIRPADANETAEAWRMALKIKNGPTALVLTRQNLPTLDRSLMAPADNLAYGAYAVNEPDKTHSRTYHNGFRFGNFHRPESPGTTESQGNSIRGWSACPVGNYSNGNLKNTATGYCRRKLRPGWLLRPEVL